MFLFLLTIAALCVNCVVAQPCEKITVDWGIHCGRFAEPCPTHQDLYYNCSSERPQTTNSGDTVGPTLPFPPYAIRVSVIPSIDPEPSVAILQCGGPEIMITRIHATCNELIVLNCSSNVLTVQTQNVYLHNISVCHPSNVTAQTSTTEAGSTVSSTSSTTSETTETPEQPTTDPLGSSQVMTTTPPEVSDTLDMTLPVIGVISLACVVSSVVAVCSGLIKIKSALSRKSEEEVVNKYKTYLKIKEEAGKRQISFSDELAALKARAEKTTYKPIPSPEGAYRYGGVYKHEAQLGALAANLRGVDQRVSEFNECFMVPGVRARHALGSINWVRIMEKQSDLSPADDELHLLGSGGFKSVYKLTPRYWSGEPMALATCKVAGPDAFRESFPDFIVALLVTQEDHPVSLDQLSDMSSSRYLKSRGERLSEGTTEEEYNVSEIKNIQKDHRKWSLESLTHFVPAFAMNKYTGDLLMPCMPDDFVSMDSASFWLERVDFEWDSWKAECHGLASALKFLHVSGIVHRDLWHQNIRIRRGTCFMKVFDYGLASIAGTRFESQEQCNRLLVTPALRRQDKCTSRTDNLNLICTIAFQSLSYQMTSLGHDPFPVSQKRAIVLHDALTNDDSDVSVCSLFKEHYCYDGPDDTEIHEALSRMFVLVKQEKSQCLLTVCPARNVYEQPSSQMLIRSAERTKKEVIPTDYQMMTPA